MYLRKAFRLFVILNIIICTSFSPFAGLSEGFSDPIAPTATTRTVCASGCEHTSIQAAIDASGPGDTIDLASETYTETITIDADIAIIGEGPEKTIIQAAGDPTSATDRVVAVVVTATATIDGVTIRYGRINGGGGIHNRGTLTVTNSIIISNTVTNNGGGIFNTGKSSGEHAKLTIIDSVVQGNIGTTFYHGGGIYNYANFGNATINMIRTTVIGNANDDGGGISNYSDYGIATVNVSQSLIKDNISFFGGGIHNLNWAATGKAKVNISDSTVDGNDSLNKGGGIYSESVYGSSLVNIFNSTLHDNYAASDGGGIYNFAQQANATISLSNVTISSNEADLGGGIYNYGWDNAAEINILATSIISNTASSGTGGVRNDLDPSSLSSSATISMTNSIIANSVNADCTTITANGAVFNNIGYNIIETASTSCGSSGDGDPGVGPIQDNGGPTFTHALLPGSLALDAIPSGSCLVDTDQRGWIRPIGSGCDIGSFEFGNLVYLPLILR